VVAGLGSGGVFLEGFVGGDSFGEGKGDGGILVVFWSCGRIKGDGGGRR